jgi:hypothetical protein
LRQQVVVDATAGKIVEHLIGLHEISARHGGQFRHVVVGVERRAGHGKERHRLGKAVDRGAPLLAHEQQDG